MRRSVERLFRSNVVLFSVWAQGMSSNVSSRLQTNNESASQRRLPPLLSAPAPSTLA